MITAFSVFFSVFFCFLVFFLIYKGKLKEQYAILWLILSGVMIFFSFFRESIGFLADFFEVHYAPSLLFILAFVILLLVLIQMSVVVSLLKENIKTLTQEVGLLKKELAEKKDGK